MKHCTNLNIKLLIFGMILSLFTTACGPTIYYLGDTYEASDQVDTYYDEKDVKKAYKTIGQMTNDQFINYAPELVRAEMIKEAKKRGADGIIFTDVAVEKPNEEETEKLAVKAKLIKYIEQENQL